MMFIPNEGAYIAAMQLEPDLWQEAYDRQVLIISPTHLFSVLRLVEQMWRHDAQTRNAVEIAVEAGKMYDKFAGFVADMQNVEKNLGRATDAYGEAMRKLSSGTGNLLTRAQRLRELGAKTSKELGIKGE
jgi:DNA recombination protein RmuC